MQETKIRDHMIITGDVQGVGFRYRAKHAAELLGVTGWVRNEWDGSVEMEAQGTKEQMNEMFLLIAKGSYIQINHISHKEMPLDEEERGFYVRS